MGQAKNALIEAEGRGYWSIEGKVCRSCILDDDLAGLITGRKGTCTYCGKRAAVTSAALIQDRIMESLFEEYELAQQADLPWDGREGGWQVDTEEAEDVIANGISGVVPYQYEQDIIAAVTDTAWVTKDWALLHPYERLTHGWHAFCQTVMHHHRFTFAFEAEDDPDHPDSVSPAKTLQSLGYLIQHHGLLTRVPKGETLYRIRADEVGVKHNTFDSLSSPPMGRAGANRMSPGGMPMFYGSPHIPTAIAETWDQQKAVTVSIGRFVTTRSIWLVNLQDLPPVPGFYSGKNRADRGALQFLQDLAKDASKPIARDGREHFEYAPTQIVAEYLMMAHQFKAQGGGTPIAISGIKFGSSKTQKPNIVLNVKHADHEFGTKASEILSLKSVSYKNLTP